MFEGGSLEQNCLHMLLRRPTRTAARTLEGTHCRLKSVDAKEELLAILIVPNRHIVQASPRFDDH